MFSPFVPQQEVKQASYEFFILVVSVLAVVNTVLLLLPLLSQVNDEVLRTINRALALLFLIDFIYRFVKTKSKAGYFLTRFGWADLLSAVPFPVFQFFRLARIIRSTFLARRLGRRATSTEITGDRAGSALFLALLLAILLVQISAMLIVSVESADPTANIQSGGDAIWWAYVTITTIGYGDFYPVTSAGRWLGVMIMTVGVGLFGVLTGFLANAFLLRPKAARETTGSEGDNEQAPGEHEEMLNQMAYLRQLSADQEQHFKRLQEQMLKMEEQLRAQSQMSSDDT